MTYFHGISNGDLCHIPDCDLLHIPKREAGKLSEVFGFPLTGEPRQDWNVEMWQASSNVTQRKSPPMDSHRGRRIRITRFDYHRGLRLHCQRYYADTGLAWGCVIAVAGAQTISTSSGQAYPTRPIRLVVPVASGGNLDLVGRSVAQELTESLGRPMIVENRSGASTTIGAEDVARSAPDGYTYLMVTPSFLIAPMMMRNAPYNPVGISRG